MKKAFGRRVFPFLRARGGSNVRRLRRFEPLEARHVLAAPTLAVIPNQTLLAGAPLHIPLDGFDADSLDVLTFTAQSNNGSIATLIDHDNRSMKIAVSHTSSGPTDPAFTGEMIFELFEDRTPRTTGQIIGLAQSGFYNGSTFHRVDKNFVIQGGIGAPGTSPAPEMDDELLASLQHTSVGLLSMAKTGFDDTGNSQFFVTSADPRFLDTNHTVFGRLTHGEEVRQQIANVAVTSTPGNPNSKPPVTPVTMTSVSIASDPHHRVLTISAPIGATGEGDITITVSDGNGGTTQRTFHVTIAPDPEDNQPFLLDAQNPFEINTTVGTAHTFTIKGLDIEGQSFFYSGVASSNLLLDVNPTTGATTVTPLPNFVGVELIRVTASTTQNVPRNQFGPQVPADDQFIAVLVSPLAPTGLDLVSGADTGAKLGDNVTRFNNSNVANALQFQVSGTVSGATVELFNGPTLIGQATATGTTTVVTTNAFATLAEGLHTITAVQTMRNQSLRPFDLDGYNRTGTVNLASLPSAPLSIRVTPKDWQNPTQRLDVDGDGTIANLDALVIINELDDGGGGALVADPPAETFYFDVDGDGTLAPIDALQVINQLDTTGLAALAAPMDSPLAAAAVDAAFDEPAQASPAAELDSLADAVDAVVAQDADGPLARKRGRLAGLAR